MHYEFCIYHDERNDKMASPKGLGKGLGALLGDFMDEIPENSAYQMLPIYKVEPNRSQPRQDFDEEELQALADSIEEHGKIGRAHV